jgi:nucleotide-binding universal stress UspA family protein
MYKHILIPTDGSELSQKAIDHGAKLAKTLNAKITMLTVSEPFHIFALDPTIVTGTPAEYNVLLMLPRNISRQPRTSLPRPASRAMGCMLSMSSPIGRLSTQQARWDAMQL